MKTLLGLFVVLSLLVYTIPMEEWQAMSKPQRKDRLKKGIEVIKKELGCSNPSIELAIDKDNLYILGECDKGTFIATEKGRIEL